MSRRITLTFLILGTSLAESGLLPSWNQKWLIIEFSCFLLLLQILWSPTFKIKIPKLDPRSSFLLVLVGAASVTSFIWHWPDVSLLRVTERICFVALVLYFLSLWTDKPETCVPLRWLLGLSLVLLTGSFVLNIKHCYGFWLGSFVGCEVLPFDNRNMMMEAMVLQLTLLGFTFAFDSLSRVQSWILLGLGAAILIQAVLLHTRSALGILLISVLWMAFKEVKIRWPKRSWLLPASFAALAGVLLMRFPLVGFSVDERMRMSMDAVVISAKHLLGVGMGGFMWAELPYQRLAGSYNNMFIKSPHNEILRFAAEEGWLTAVAVYSFLALLIWGAWKNLDRLSNMGQFSLASLTAFFVVQTFSQFPLENPFPTLGLACGFSFLTFPMEFREWEWRGWPVKCVALTLSLFLSLTMASQFYFFVSRKRGAASPAVDRALCRASIDYWSLCADASLRLLKEGRSEEGHALLDWAIKRQPANLILKELKQDLHFD